jgi:hypothetical protein
MPIPTQPAFFPPQQERSVFAARSCLFLIDPGRLHDEAGTHILGKDLLPRIHQKPLGDRLYAAGTMVPALGLELGFYTVDIRSTATESAPIALTHIVFSTGFVLGTETGQLILCNGDRLTPWNPGTPPPSRTPMPLSNFERPIEVSPGWYTATVVVGLLESPEAEEPASQATEDYVFNQDTWDEDTQTHRPQRRPFRPRQVEQEEQWICSFLLDPQPEKPAFSADRNKSLNLFGN